MSQNIVDNKWHVCHILSRKPKTKKMTIYQILKTVCPAKGKITRRHVYRYLHACKIQPLGIRQRPQQYPEDSAKRILCHLGLATAPAEPVEKHRAAVKLVSTAQLRAAKPQRKIIK
jgi:hypothetical protein